MGDTSVFLHLQSPAESHITNGARPHGILAFVPQDVLSKIATAFVRRTAMGTNVFAIVVLVAIDRKIVVGKVGEGLRIDGAAAIRRWAPVSRNQP